jgi:hypothetical protein
MCRITEHSLVLKWFTLWPTLDELPAADDYLLKMYRYVAHNVAEPNKRNAFVAYLAFTHAFAIWNSPQLAWGTVISGSAALETPSAIRCREVRR